MLLPAQIVVAVELAVTLGVTDAETVPLFDTVFALAPPAEATVIFSELYDAAVSPAFNRTYTVLGCPVILPPAKAKDADAPNVVLFDDTS